MDKLLRMQSGVAAVRQLAIFETEKVTRHRLNSGKWQRPVRGVLVAHNGPLTFDQRLWIAVLAMGKGAILGGVTAAVRCGLRTSLTSAIHVLINEARGSLVAPPGVVIHRTSTLVDSDINRLGRPPHTRIVRSIIDGAAWAKTDDEAYVLIISAVQQRLVAPGKFDEHLSRLGNVRRRALICNAVSEAASGVGSLPERELVTGLRRNRLPVPQLQVRRRDGDGRNHYLDGYYPRWKLHLEVDGAGHLDVTTYWADMKRQNDIWLAGDRVLRFSGAAVRLHLEEVVEQIRKALFAAGWRPDSGRFPPIQGRNSSESS